MKNLYLFHIPLTYYFIIFTLLFIKIPLIGKFFKVINTVIHELGHAIVSLLLSGKVQKIELFSSSEGVTVTQCSRPWKAFFISLSGYPFASVVSYIFFYFLSQGFEKELIINRKFQKTYTKPRNFFLPACQEAAANIQQLFNENMERLSR